ncbi:hypothetical protein LUZ63_019160 [Rhynchospora breviuscula]|uniref:Pentatricopeptide repeat-containing protein n=1 Tax=Rhynchospora breviuscula TaxID=2022672 RepID=A0A9Q0C5Y1_9POAL|nr:hypothetical protein LUZ63_019160 [Rhynchospora breviuscula]
MAATSAVRWPRVLTPAYLAYLIRRQKNPLSALNLFLTSPHLFPSYRHNSQVYASLSSVLLSSPSLSPLLPSLLLPSFTPHSPPPPTCGASDSVTWSLTEMHWSRINALNGARGSVTVSELESPPLPDSLFADVISSLPLHLSLPLFLSVPSSTCVAWTKSFHCILSKLLSNGEVATAIKVFRQFSCHSQVKIGSETLDLLIAHLVGIKRADLALDLYMEYYNLCCFPSQNTCQILVKGLIEVRMLDEAMHLLYSMMRDYNIDAIVVTCRTVIEELCVSGRAKEGELVLKKVLNKIRRRTGRVRSFLRVPIDLAGKSLEEVRETVDVALSVSGARSVAAYEVMARDLFQEGRFQAAQKVFDEMSSKGFRPSIAMFEAKIMALCREGKMNDALQVLEQEMRERDIAPTVTIFNLLIDGLCKSSQSMRAVGYLKTMNQWPGCKAGKETFEILIDGLCAEKRFIKAAGTLDEMVKCGHRPKNEAFLCVVHGLCDVGIRYEAVVWLEEMVAHGVVPDGTLWSSLISLVLE